MINRQVRQFYIDKENVDHYRTSYDIAVWNTSFICNCYFMVVLQGCKPVICSYQ